MKKLALLFVITFIVGFVAAPAMAAGNSKVRHLYLYEKSCADPWTIVPGGAWGKMKYNKSGPTLDIVFNGHGLEPGWEYQLIYAPDPWPQTGLIHLGGGTANKGGQVHIAASTDTEGDLPIATDDNAGLIPPGAKIWLVLEGDTDGGEMTAWNCSDYLFESNLITFVDTGDGDDDDDDDNDKVTICHIPPGNPGKAHTITISQDAVPAHLAHGDTLGPC